MCAMKEEKRLSTSLLHRFIKLSDSHTQTHTHANTHNSTRDKKIIIREEQKCVWVCSGTLLTHLHTHTHTGAHA